MPPRAYWIVAALVYSLCASPFFSGCGRRAPELIAVSGLAPERLEERDLLTISGEGFVVGSEALVQFAGTAFGPGRAPQKVNMRARGLAVDSTTVELPITGDFATAVLGSELDAPSHATFRGTVRVAFAPRTPGAPPIEGQSRDLVLDVFKERVSDAGPALGTVVKQSAILEFLGMTVEELGDKGLLVENVASSRPAHGAGLMPGDRIVTWGDVRVHRISDLEPYPGQRLVQADVAREGVAGTFPLVVPVEGYILPSARGWWSGLVILGLLVVPLFVSRSVFSRWFVWLAISGTRQPPASGEQSSPHRLAIGPFLTVSLVFLGVSATRRFLPDELDLVWLMLGTSLMIALSATAKARRGRHFSLGALFGLLVRQLPVHIALWACTLVIVLDHGRASVWELAALQTLDPRTYGAFASPSSFLAVLTLGFSSFLLALSPYRRSSEDSAFWRRVARVSGVLGDAASLLLLAMSVAVFFGGWSLGGAPTRVLGVFEALGFQVKFTLCYLAFVALRLTIPRLPADALEFFGTRALLPLVAIALAALPVWSADIWPGWVRSGVQSLLLGMGGVFAIGAPVLVANLRRLTGARLRVSGINPWI